MEIKVAILGNSHVIAVASALRASPAQGQHITCFDPFHVWNETAAVKGAAKTEILARSITGAETRIVLDDFAIIVVCAGGWWAGRNVSFQGNGNSHPLAHVALPKWRQTEAAAAKRFSLVSQDVLEATVYGWVNQHRISDLIRLISGMREKTVVWQPWPAPSRELRRDANWILNSYYGDCAGAVWADFFRAQYKALARISAKAGDNVSLLPYPIAGTLEEGFMAAEFCDTDPFHANASYGALVLEQLRKYLG